MEKVINYEEGIVRAIFDGESDEDVASIFPFWSAGEDESPRETPLTACILEKRYSLVDPLLEKYKKHKAAINIKNLAGSTALLLAVTDASEEGLEVVRKLCIAGADVRSQDYLGWGALTIASLNAPDIRLLDLLIQHGAEVNETSAPLGITPLMAASMREDQNGEHVSYLLEKGANTSVLTTENTTARDLALEAGNRRAAEILEGTVIPEPGIIEQARAAIDNAINRVRDFGITIQNALAQTQLQLAAAGGVLGGEEGEENPLAGLSEQVEEVKMPSGQTPLMLASMAPNPAKVAALLQEGADPNASDEFSWTPLHYALSARIVLNIKALLDNGADPNVLDDQRICALSYAAMFFYLDGLRQLLEKNVNPNQRDMYGRTPLFYLIEVSGMDDEQRCEALNLLLEHGADPKVKDFDGVTPLLLAETANNGSHEVLTAYISAKNRE